MSPTTQKFGWKDRDTAARDLLQLVYHAPEIISLDALSLLEAIRSPAVVPELLDIFRDDVRSEWERIYALRAVTCTPIDLYMPELKAYLHVNETLRHSFSAPFQWDILLFASRHTSNHQWLMGYEKELFDYLDTLSPAEQIQRLREFADVYGLLEQFVFTSLDRGMQIIEQQPELLDPDTVRWLRYNDSRQSTQKWLDVHVPRLVELCLTIDAKAKPEELAYFLEDSESLREAVFQAAPALMSIYQAAKAQVDADRARHRFGVNPNYSAIWHELTFLHQRAEAGNQEALERLKARTGAKDILEQAAAVHFFGKLKQTPGYLPTMLRLLKYPSRRYWRALGRGIAYIPVIFEAGAALRDQPSAEVWEAFISVFFRGVGDEGRRPFLDWIAYQTDRLSGIEVEYTGATWDVERRPWFRALVEREGETE